MIRAILLLAAVLVTATPSPGQDVTVAAASDLQVALPEVLQRFEAATKLRVRPIYGSSGTLTTQIENGAPFDVFMSADVEYPRRLVNAGLADRHAVVSYAVGRLVLWTRKDSGIDVSRGVKGLAMATGRRIAIANPLHAPYGRAAVAVFKHEGVYDAVQSRLVYGENISQTAQFAQSGNASAALIALALAVGPLLTASGHYLEIPAAWHPPIEQAAVWLKRAKNVDAARQFVQFLTAPAIVAYLQKMGFEPAP